MPPTAADPIPLPLLSRGKVRDLYDLGDELLLVASDRVSAFDVVLPATVPGKGAILTQLSAWWFERTADLVPHHLITADPDRIVRRHPRLAPARAAWAHRAMLVRRLSPLPVECVVRGYLAGSAWEEYRRSGTLAGEPLPPELVQAGRLDPPLFSPATKAREGHDENIPWPRFREIVGSEVGEGLREVSLALYRRGARVAQEAGIILADTKFEFSLDAAGGPVLIDELLTPDSSRYWPADRYAPGSTPPALDKQPLRDWLSGEVAAGRWDRRPPGPPLPEGVVARMAERYREVFTRLTRTAPVLP